MDSLGISAVELSEEYERVFGRRVPAQSIRQARLDPSTRGHRPPPRQWEKVIARIARDRIRAIQELAELDAAREEREWTDPRSSTPYRIVLRRRTDRSWGPAKVAFFGSGTWYATDWRLGALSAASDGELMGMLDRAVVEAGRY
jgi:hypothetical protein